jgi:hypothetical protein
VLHGFTARSSSATAKLSLFSFSDRERFTERVGVSLDIEEDAPKDMMAAIARGAMLPGRDGDGCCGMFPGHNALRGDGGTCLGDAVEINVGNDFLDTIERL